MKLCPYCAEEIQDAAIVCKHCKRDISTPLQFHHNSAIKSKGTRSYVKTAAIIVVGGLIAYVIIKTLRDEKEDLFRYERPTEAMKNIGAH